jgi:hypothetical protein
MHDDQIVHDKRRSGEAPFGRFGSRISEDVALPKEASAGKIQGAQRSFCAERKDAFTDHGRRRARADSPE